MSEPMSSVEIEDVLSSIRRLVSEDHRPAAQSAPRPAEDKLLLTPSLRVVPTKAEAPKKPLPRLHLGGEPPKEVLAATLERAVTEQDVEWESEVGDPIPFAAEMEWTENGWAASPATPDAAPSAPWDQQAEDEAPASPPTASAAVETVEDPLWADRAEAEVVAALEASNDAAAPYVLEAAPVFEAEPAVEAVPEPDTTPEPAAETSFAPPPRAEVLEDEPAPDTPQMLFDEEVLRGLVRDILREELQGPLGERITRSVRKLVHAEIARMIATQDLE